jgi:hypothetical protein
MLSLRLMVTVRRLSTATMAAQAQPSLWDGKHIG